MNHAPRKITCVTGTRADYPRVKSVLHEIKSRSSLKLSIIVTGSHLLEDYGYSAWEITEDGFTIDYSVPMYTEDYDTPYGMAKSAAKCSAGVADALATLNPDIVLLTVDRVETLAAAVSSSLMNFPIAHIQGGEVTGTIDESIRHAVTKMSHLHFPATDSAAQRIVRMGENPEMVFTVGCPYLDIISAVQPTSKDELAIKYQFSASKPIIIFTQHPVTTEYGLSEDQIKTTISALERFPKVQILSFFSNADAGGKEIINAIKNKTNFFHFSNIPSHDFLSLMSCANAMVGNSSAALREAPSFKLPAVNIGSRQQGRLRACNVIDVSHNKDDIEKAINKALYDDNFKNKMKNLVNPYGDGQSAQRIVDILEKFSLSHNLIQKQLSYEI